MSLFETDFKKVFYELTPWWKRQPITLAWNYVKAETINQSRQTFNSFRLFQLYCLSFTGQINYLTRWLNDQYDPALRRIFISDTANISRTFIRRKIELRPPAFVYRKSEAKPPRYLLRKTEFANQTQFIVNIPVGVPFVETRLRAQLAKWVIAGKNYTIVTF